MKTLSYIIEYATISPAVLESALTPHLMGFMAWKDINEDFFEFTLNVREEDAASVERRIAQYV